MVENKWRLIEPSAPAIGLCFLRKYVTFRIALPVEKKFTIISPGSRLVVFGDRFEITQDKPFGGQCQGKQYRLKGRHQGSNFINPVVGEFDNEGFENVVYGKVTWNRLIPPVTFLGSTEFDPVYVEMSWFDSEGNPQGFGSPFPVDLQVFVLWTNLGIPINVTPLSWGSGIFSFGRRIYYTTDFQFTHWERLDGTSLEDDRIECPDDVGFLVTIYDCDDNVVFVKTYPEAPPTILTEEIPGYAPPEYLEIPLNNIMGANVSFFTDQTVTPIRYITRISLLAPLVPPDLLPDLNPLDPDEITEVDFRDFVSSECTDRWAKVEYICGRCEPCPQGTLCSIQQGNMICCYDANGNLIGEVEPGCNEPDIIC